ncbi:MAG: DoxX family membrane protein [Caldilineales bacterium]
MATLQDTSSPARFVGTLEDPPVARALFGDVRWAWIWLILRLYVGWEWLNAGWGKVNNPAWVGGQAGAALTGFLNNAISQTTGAHPTVQVWYAWFLQHVVLPNASVWSYAVSFGELLVGIALILGLFTGIAAFFGSFMNINYLMAGAVSTNPILFSIATLLVLAWKTAGWWGLDQWVLPALGTPWRPGRSVHHLAPPSPQSTAT